MTLINTSSFSAFLIEGIKKSYGTAYDAWPVLYQKFFDEESSTKATEIYREVISLGLHTAKGEAQNTTLDYASQGPQTLIDNIAYSLGYQITHEELSDCLYPDMLKKATDLGSSAAETIETKATDRLNTAFSTDPLDVLRSDGKPMCAVDHPIYGTGGTGQNRPTNGSSLSEASLISDLNNVASIVSPRGRKVMVKADMLIVPQYYDVTAQKLINNTLQIQSANHDLNPFGRSWGRLPQGFVTSQYITNPSYYFLRTSVKGLVFQKREMPARLMEDMIIRSMVKEVISYMRFGIGCYDWRSIYGNPGV